MAASPSPCDLCDAVHILDCQYQKRLTEWEAWYLEEVMVILAVISFVALVPVILTFAISKQKRESQGGLFTLCFISCLAFVELFRSFPLFLGGSEQVVCHPGVCVSQAVFTQFFALFAMLTWFVITVNLYMLLPSRRGTRCRWLTTPWSLLAAAGFALVMTIIPLVGDNLGPQPFYCWFGPKDVAPWTTENQVFAVGCYYLWALLMVVVGTVLWVRIVVEMRRIHQRTKGYVALMAHKGSTQVQNVPEPVSFTRQVVMVFMVLLVFLMMASNNVINALGGSGFRTMMVNNVAISCIGLMAALVVGPSRSNLNIWRDFLCCRWGPKNGVDATTNLSPLASTASA